MSWGVTFGLVNGTVQAFKDSLLNLEMDVGIDAISDEAFESFASLLFLNKYSRKIFWRRNCSSRNRFWTWSYFSTSFRFWRRCR